MTKKKTERPPKHVHKYVKVSSKFSFIWKCADPMCKHFVYGAQEYIVIGRASICWSCDNLFTLTNEAMKDETPRCDECRAGDISIDENMDIDDIIAQTRKKL
jgi:hypothetical protein